MLNVCSINSTSSLISLRITKVCRSETKDLKEMGSRDQTDIKED